MPSLLSRMIILTMFFLLVGKIGFSFIEKLSDTSDRIESISDSKESDDSHESEEIMKSSTFQSTLCKHFLILPLEIENKIHQEIVLGVNDTIIGISSPPPES